MRNFSKIGNSGGKSVENLAKDRKQKENKNG